MTLTALDQTRQHMGIQIPIPGSLTAAHQAMNLAMRINMGVFYGAGMTTTTTRLGRVPTLGAQVAMAIAVAAAFRHKTAFDTGLVQLAVLLSPGGVIRGVRVPVATLFPAWTHVVP